MTPSHLKCHDTQEDKERGERRAQDSGQRNRVGLGTGMAGGSDQRLAVACRRLQQKTAQRDGCSAVLVFVPLSPAVPPPPKLTHTDRSTSLAHASRQPFSLSPGCECCSCSLPATPPLLPLSLTDSRPYFACIPSARQVCCQKQRRRRGSSSRRQRLAKGERFTSLDFVFQSKSTRLLLKNTPSSPFPSLLIPFSFPCYITSFSVNLLVINLLFFLCVCLVP